jgi:F-type H+-transporting ATPase subunit gamma
MASLDDLKKRIASVKSTQKITKAMKMVAAANLEEPRKVLRREDLILKK